MIRLIGSSGLALWLILAASTVAANRVTGLGDVAGDTVLDRAEGLLIDSIEIDNRNIYDTEDPRYDNFIFRTANHLHVRTREKTVRRELLFARGDTFSTTLVEETARNLRSNLILYDAWIETEILSDDRVLVRVVTMDQWSLSGGLQVGREGNESNLRLEVTEKNLLGNSQFLNFTYFFESEEPDYLTGRFLDRRLWGRDYSMMAAFSNNPESKYHRATFSHPFYDLSQKFHWLAGYIDNSGIREVYSDSVEIAESGYEGDFVSLGFGTRHGSYSRKLTLDLKYDYRFERITSREIFSDRPADSLEALASFPNDSLYHGVGLVMIYSMMDFARLKRIDGFGYTEDFTLGPAIGFNVYRAFGKDDVLFDAFGMGVSYSGLWSSTIFRFSAEDKLWYDDGDTYRNVTSLSAKIYNRSVDFFTLAFSAGFRADAESDDGNPLTLGGTTGLRVYDKYFKTGDRRAVLNLEGRFFPDIEILSVMLGGVLFVDAGRTWKVGEPFRIRDFYGSVGGGLRISFERSSKTALVRWDVAYSEKMGWQLSLGAGQYFGARGDRLPLTTR